MTPSSVGLPGFNMPRHRRHIASGSAWRLCIGPSLLVLGIGLWLDFFVDLDTCGYDACRYVKFTYLEYIETFGDDFVSATTLMHYLYGGLGAEGMPFLRAAIGHALLFVILVVAFRVENPVMKSPLFIAMMAIPSKEFFLLMAVLLIFPGKAGVVRRRTWLLRLGLAVILIALVRLPYIALYFVAYLLAYVYRRKGWMEFTIMLLISAMVLMILMGLVGFKDGVREIADQEATVGVVNSLRDYSFGFSPSAGVFRSVVYIAYLVFLPFAELIRAVGEVSVGNFYPAQPFLWAASFEWAIYVLWRSKGLAFVVILVAAVLVALVFPFIHTRYLLPLILFVHAFALGRQNSQPFALWLQ